MNAWTYLKGWSSLAIVASSVLALSAGAANPAPDARSLGRTGIVSRANLDWTEENVPRIFDIFGAYQLDYCKRVIADASRRIDRNPKDAVAYQIRGFARWRVEQFSGARDDLRLAQKLSPEIARDANVYYILGECDSQLAETKLAIEDFTKAIDLHPIKPPNFYLRRAEAYSSIDDFKHALPDADKLIGKGATYAWAYEFRADIHSHLKQYPDAIKDYNKALSFKQHEVKDLALRASIYDVLGDKKSADMDRRKLKEITDSSDFGF